MNKSILKRLSSISILFVEDDELLRNEIIDALELYCKKIFVATNGQDGYELYCSHLPNIILTDIHLPVLNGLAMVRKIRTINKNIPVIILTAYDTVDNIEKSIDMNVTSFLHKPFEIEQLYNALLMASGQFSQNKNIKNLGQGFSYDVYNKILYKNNEIIHLTKSEMKLLQILIDNQGYMVSYDAIEKFVWFDKGATPDTIRMYVNKLRAKLYYDLIDNIKGLGYQLK
jgi:DNA-binding response OmpR family regulator